MLSRRHLLATTAAMAATPAWASTETVGSNFRSLLYGEDDEQTTALDWLAARGGVDLVAGLIFAMRFAHWQDVRISSVLQDITGDPAPRTWFDWMVWQERHPEVTPHPSYLEIKRELYLRIDPQFEIFFRDEHMARDQMKIRLEEITWGGVKKDGIPSLDGPKMIPAAEADYLVGSDLVFGVAIDGDIRAYPLRIMGWHEMFNDVVGGVPLALAYCTLCGSGILFETDMGRDSPFIFGSSGFLYRSNKLMFDRETHSLWNQFTGKPVSGPLVGSGIELRQRPVVIEPWVRWFARNPNSKVLSLETGYERDYGSGVVYSKYFSSPKLMFPAQVDETRLAQKDYVFGIRTFGASKAWPVTAFEGGLVINDRVGDLDVVLVGDRLGRTVRAYDRGGRTFQAGQSSAEVRDSSGTWQVTEEFLLGPDGQRAPRVAGHIAFWFAWDGYLGARSEFYEG
ncbi:MAG: DUF3179 domain-containing protein [Pseudomonadota bacterium]